MHGGDGGATAVRFRYHGGTTAVMAVPRRSHCGLAQPAVACESFEHVQSSRRAPGKVRNFDSFRGATAITDGTTAEPRRSWRCQCGLCRKSTAVAPRLRCDGTSTAEARRNMLKVVAVPSRRSAVFTVFRGATTINDGTTVEPRRAWRCHCGLCRASTAVAPRLRCDGGINVAGYFIRGEASNTLKLETVQRRSARRIMQNYN